MNRKRILTVPIIGIITLAFSAPAAWAGSPGQHRLEGFAIGIGALILTKAIIDQHQYTAEVSARPVEAYTHHRPRPSGYWDIQKEWVAAEYKRVWNPGHYGRHGAWINGHWKRIEVSPGHWAKKRVWVAYR